MKEPYETNEARERRLQQERITENQERDLMGFQRVIEASLEEMPAKINIEGVKG
jgi:hypothetical protein